MRAIKHKNAMGERFDEMVDAVFCKWDNPRKTRETVVKKLASDWRNPDRMAIWRIAETSNSWKIV